MIFIFKLIYIYIPHTANSVEVALIVAALVTIAEVLVPRVAAVVLSTTPIDGRTKTSDLFLNFIHLI